MLSQRRRTWSGIKLEREPRGGEKRERAATRHHWTDQAGTQTDRQTGRQADGQEQSTRRECARSTRGGNLIAIFSCQTQLCFLLFFFLSTTSSLLLPPCPFFSRLFRISLSLLSLLSPHHIPLSCHVVLPEDQPRQGCRQGLHLPLGNHPALGPLFSCPALCLHCSAYPTNTVQLLPQQPNQHRLWATVNQSAQGSQRQQDSSPPWLMPPDMSDPGSVDPPAGMIRPIARRRLLFVIFQTE